MLESAFKLFLICVMRSHKSDSTAIPEKAVEHTSQAQVMAPIYVGRSRFLYMCLYEHSWGNI